MKVVVGISARHVHLTEEDVDILFGSGYKLTKFKDLFQPDQFASNEVITIKTDNGMFENVRVLGPTRNYTQVEISKTDSYTLKINPPNRQSGDLEGAEIVTIVGPKGEVTKSCCIIANRHIHINKEQRKLKGLENIDKVSLKIKGDRGGILEEVYIKEDDNYTFECHLDLDDGNAMQIKQKEELEIVLVKE